MDKIIKIYEELYNEIYYSTHISNNKDNKTKKIELKMHNITFIIEGNDINIDAAGGTIYVSGIDIRKIDNLPPKTIDNKLYLIIDFINKCGIYYYTDGQYICTLDYILFLVTNKSFMTFIKRYKNENNEDGLNNSQNVFFNNIEMFINKKFEEEKIIEKSLIYEKTKKEKEIERLFNYISTKINTQFYFMYIYQDLHLNEFIDTSLYYYEDNKINNLENQVKNLTIEVNNLKKEMAKNNERFIKNIQFKTERVSETNYIPSEKNKNQ